MEDTRCNDTRLPSAFGPRTQFLSFAVAGRQYGIVILKVREILRLDAITRVPSTSEYIRGVVDLRGKVVPIVHLARKLGMAETTVTKWACILVVEIARDGASLTIGILVDAVREIFELSGDEMSAPPEFGPGTEYLTGTARVGEQLVLLLDLDRAISAADVEAMNVLAAGGGGSRTTSSAMGEIGSGLQSSSARVPGAATPPCGEGVGDVDRKAGVLLLAARVGIGLVFLASGFGKVAGWSGVVAYAATMGIPPILLAGATVLETFGAISLVAGWKTRWGATALVAFLVAAALVFHGFWAARGADVQLQMIQFLKNVAIGGGLLALIAVGPGPFSIDARTG